MRRGVVMLIAALNTGAHAQPLSDAFDQGATLGRSGNQTARGEISNSTAPSKVPGYTANPPEAAYFGGAGISAPATAATRACADAGRDKGSFSAQGCNAVDFSQTNPSRHPSFTFGPNDPLRTGAKTITANPESIAGNIAGTYSDCTVQTSTQPPVFETLMCHQVRTMERLSCDKVLIVSPVSTPGCSPGQFLTHVSADPCPSCVDTLAYDFTCGASGYVMHVFTIDKDSGHVNTELGTQNVPGALTTHIPKTAGPSRIDGFYCFETFYSQTCAGTNCTIGVWFSNPCQDTSNYGVSTFAMPTTISFNDTWDDQCAALEARAR